MNWDDIIMRSEIKTREFYNEKDAWVQRALYNSITPMEIADIVYQEEGKCMKFKECLKCTHADNPWRCAACYNGNMFVPIEHTIKTEYHTIGRRSGKNMAVNEYLNMLYGTKALPRIKDVIFNDPATIVIWEDGSKTIVKVMEGDKFDPHTGLAQAISKKALGDDYKKEFKKWTKTFKGTRKHRKILEMREKFEASKVKRTKKPMTLTEALELVAKNWEQVKSNLIRKGVIG